MGGGFWLTEAQMGRLRPFFPKSRGRKRVDCQSASKTDLLSASNFDPVGTTKIGA